MKSSAPPSKKTSKLARYRKQETVEYLGRDFVVFTLADETYSVGIDKVQEIIKPQQITAIPHTPGFLSGVVNLRGKIVPVVDLRNRFSIPPCDATKHTRIVVVIYDEQALGMVVDRVLAVMPIPDKSIEPAPDISYGPVQPDFFDGVANLDGKVYVILNIDKVLERKDRKRKGRSPAGG